MSLKVTVDEDLPRQAVRMKEIASFLTSDLLAAQQACQTLTAMPLSPSTLELADEIFCLEK